MNEGVVFFAFAAFVMLLFFAVTLPVVIFINRQIGKSYDENARLVFAQIPMEGILFAEDDVAMRLSSVAFLAVGIRWGRADVRVTQRGLYIAQWRKTWFGRMGQPVILIALTPFGLDPSVAARGSPMQVAGQPTFDGRAFELPLTRSIARHRLHLEPRAGAAFAAVVERVMYPR